MPAATRASVICLVAALLAPLAAAGAQGVPADAVPAEYLRTLSRAVDEIRRNYVTVPDDARLAAACGRALAKATGEPEATGAELLDLRAVPEALRNAWRDTAEASGFEKLVYACIDGMARSLDVHSSYYFGDSYQDLIAPRGGLAGVGLELAERNGRIEVVDVVPGTPAERADVRPGDILGAIDGASLDGIPLAQVIRRLRGDPKTPIVLTVARDGATLSRAMQREPIRLVDSRVAWLDGDLLYIRVTQYRETTTNDLRRRVLEETNGSERLPQRIVLDLRDNSGGLLSTITELAGLFLPDGLLVGTMDGRNDASRVKLVTGDKSLVRLPVPRSGMFGDALTGVLRSAPMAVLVNQRTASGAEMLASTLRAHGRAVLVGTPTFGTGSIQTILAIGRTALRLTTAYWYDPRGTRIEGSPVQPDIAIDGPRVTGVRVDVTGDPVLARARQALVAGKPEP